MSRALFGERLITLRERRNLTRTKLADELKMNYSTIANYENGEREPDFEVFKILASDYKVSTDYLIGYVDTELDHVKVQNLLTECFKVTEKTQDYVIYLLRSINEGDK